jgi:lipopolysaccharide export system permease protein
MKILSRYIFNRIIIATSIVLLLVVAITTFISLLEELPRTGVHNYSVWQAILYILMRLPASVYQLFPMVGFLGCLMGLGSLSSTSELVAMRSFGLSRQAILRQVIYSATLLLVIVTLMGEFIAPKLLVDAQLYRQRAMGRIKTFSADKIWLKKNAQFIYAGRAKSNSELENISIFSFSKSKKMLRYGFATRAIKHSNYWQLVNFSGFHFANNKLIYFKNQSSKLKLDIKPKFQVRIQSKNSDQKESILGIVKSIAYLKGIGLTSREFQYNFWQRLFQPLTTILMICLGVPLIFGSIRVVSTGVRLTVGILLGFAFFMINSFFGPIVMVLQFSPFLAAVLPTLLVYAVYRVLSSQSY